MLYLMGNYSRNKTKGYYHSHTKRIPLKNCRLISMICCKSVIHLFSQTVLPEIISDHQIAHLKG